MYLEFFGLDCKPFSLTPDPAFLYASEKHGIALSMLRYGLYEQTGITVLTGDIGMGKTTLLRSLLADVSHDHYTVGFVHNTHAEFGSLLEWVAMALQVSIHDKRPIEIYRTIEDFLINEYVQGRRTILVFDEAQNLTLSMLEQVRLLTNINTERDTLVHVILVGQPQLHDLLAHPDLTQLTQRIGSEFNITPMDFAETSQYLRHRLHVAGCDEEVFERVTRAALYYYSGGIPRIINKLADYCLLVAYAKNEASISIETLIEVLIAQNMAGKNRLKQLPKDAAAIREAIHEITGIDLNNLAEQLPTQHTDVS